MRLRPLLHSLPDTRVIRTGSLGYLDATEDDRRRWSTAFRALLDGLQGRLQAVMAFSSEAHTDLAAGLRTPAEERTDPRRLDLDWAARLSRRAGSQSREVRFVTSSELSSSVREGLARIGVPLVVEPGEPAPPVGRESPGTWWDHNGFHRSWYVERYPGGQLEPGWLIQLVPKGRDVSLSWHAERLPGAWIIEYLRRQLLHMEAARQVNEDVEDPDVAGALPAARELQQRVAAREENAFHVAMYVTVHAHGPRELEACAAEVETAGRRAMCVLRPCTFRQQDGRIATMPYGLDPLGRRRLLDTSSLVTLMPWFESDIQHPEGIVLGSARATGQPVLVDLFDERNHVNANVAVFGHSGAGKTYLLSTLAMGALGLGIQVFVIDPEHEYGTLASRLGGADVPLSLGSGHSLNVLDLHAPGPGEEEGATAIADAVDLCEMICGELDETERAEVEAAASGAVREEPEPLIADIARRLTPSSRPGTILGRWSRGSLGQLFSRSTTVDLDAPIVVFGMRELRQELVGPVHFLLAQALWGRIKRRDRRRLLVIDELGLLFEEPAIRRFVLSLARRIRKYDGALAFATQNPGDLLSSEHGRVVASNPAIQFFGAMRPGEAARVQSHFQLSDRQRSLVETARRGEFLLSAGAERLALHVAAPSWQEELMRACRPGGPISRQPLSHIHGEWHQS
ncbi:MAG TPA: DUF87 domain-containing protein [Candidatus Dormibacteraeota bacterium]|nr:DUF87 domain-containing protein [Candidatus Dormibacteraeota bacterium]